ncbi:MAG: formimidoylglutamase [Phycisphaerales bacterium]|nr:formimidoylglutamase [Phycisphaerales bacterium]
MAQLITSDPAQGAGCRIALLGLPDDCGVQLNNGRPGAADGPRAFRAALASYGVAEPAGFAWPRVFDAGDVTPAPGVHAEALSETHGRVTEAALSLHRAGLLPVAVGGGHDLTFPFVRAAVEHWRKQGGVFGGVYFDAHLDVRPTAGSGMPFRRLIEECGVGPLMVVGFNPLAAAREHVEWFSEACEGRNVIADDDLVSRIDELDGPADLLAPLAGDVRNDPVSPDHLFASFDLDAIDAAHAPGVSAMNPAGLSVRESARLVFMAASDARLRCLDIMELSPPNDDRGRTARVAAHLFLHALMGLTLGREMQSR